MQMVVEHKHKIGSQGTLLIEPKSQEPTKHQYYYDVATVYGFLKQFGLEKEIKVNVEANHATLADHSFHHEIATAIALGIFGSVDANRGDSQCCWDTDQFPVSAEENALVLYEIIKAGGFTTGGLNFDAKVRRQSTDKYDLFYGHIGAMDTLALKVAARMVEEGELDRRVVQRYSGWNGEFGQQILNGGFSLSSLAAYAQQQFNPQHRSGRQEQLENLVNHYLYDF
nr:Xylose isomerase [Candidatus Pantoea persica]